MIAGILAAMIAGLTVLYDSLSTAAGRSDIRAEADQIFRHAVTILSQPGMCAGALRGGPGSAAASNQRVVYNATTGAEIQQIQINPNPSSTGAVALYRTQVFGGGQGRLEIFEMRMRPFRADERTAPFVEPPSGGSTTVNLGYGDLTLQARAAKFTMRFKIYDRGGMGGDSLERTATFLVGVDGSGTIHDCWNTQQAKITNFRCTQATLSAPVASNRCDNEPATDPLCRNIYYIKGIDALGNPICRCETTCTSFDPNRPAPVPPAGQSTQTAIAPTPMPGPGGSR
ncbi:MAG: hypothetical protein KF799_04815 [Bdellovibrionales bacterium]|nr:hypothetical protein [Bdellovibrionales bacterium]